MKKQTDYNTTTIQAARNRLCPPRETKGKTISEVITSYDHIRFVFDDGTQIVLAARTDPGGDPELMVNYELDVIDLVDFGLLPQSYAVEYTKRKAEAEIRQLTQRLKIVEENLNNTQSTTGIIK